MEALNKLRECIVKGRPVQEEGPYLVLDGQHTYPKQLKTPFRDENGRQYYTLGALWLQYEYQNEPFMTYKSETQKREAGGFVLVTDKQVVLDYLVGNDTADKHIDLDFVPEEQENDQGQDGSAPESSRSSSSAANAQGATGSKRRSEASTEPGDGRKNQRTSTSQHDGKSPEDEVSRFLPPWCPKSINEAIQYETVFRTRHSVLQAHTGKDLRDIAFEKFSRTSENKRGTVSAEIRARERRQYLIGKGGTPMIIVPNSLTSLINLYNIRPLLVEGKFIPPDEARQSAGTGAKPAYITIRREDNRGVEMLYRVVDNADKLGSSDWNKVVAIFAHGPEWQFKGWKWGQKDGPTVGPAEIFSRCYGFHVHYDNCEVHPNIKKWNVVPLPVSAPRAIDFARFYAIRILCVFNTYTAGLKIA
eukprot:gb/GECG01013636.1/.p1 GENE.gb/GECG01013636.1/~~gb/GECG01013636.1/.p1  ORF type:complete len:417 (+),score=37.97 gb/GECG01013636.1/:1-1251(+)